MPLPQSLARFNRDVTNHLMRPLAGRLPGYAVIVHVGRKSGAHYETPVNAFEYGGGYAIPLTYGADSQWVRNVVAAGTATLRIKGEDVPVTAPEVFRDESRAAVPAAVRVALGALDVNEFLHVQRIP